VGFEKIEAIWVQISVAIEATWEIELELEAITLLHPHCTYGSFIWVFFRLSVSKPSTLYLDPRARKKFENSLFYNQSFLIEKYSSPGCCRVKIR